MTTEASPLSAEQMTAVLSAAVRAPSVHNSQPWRFHVTASGIELHADPARRLPIADPDDRELRIACGAALFNLRLALLREGVEPSVTLLPNGPAGALAAVRYAGEAHLSPADAVLYAGITRRRTNRKPFEDQPVDTEARHDLVRAAEQGHARLEVMSDPDDRAAMRRMLLDAHTQQLADPAWAAEFAEWVGRSQAARDGVRLASSGPQPEPQDTWVFRDFALGQGPARTPGKDFETEPMIAVLATYVDDAYAQLQAGEALQRVLLTATSLGLSASFLSQLIEVGQARKDLRELLGDAVHPQVVLRIGYGTPVAAAPRRPVDDVLDVD